jgi:hypothetical protein
MTGKKRLGFLSFCLRHSHPNAAGEETKRRREKEEEKKKELTNTRVVRWM